MIVHYSPWLKSPYELTSLQTKPYHISSLYLQLSITAILIHNATLLSCHFQKIATVSHFRLVWEIFKHKKTKLNWLNIIKFALNIWEHVGCKMNSGSGHVCEACVVPPGSLMVRSRRSVSFDVTQPPDSCCKCLTCLPWFLLQSLCHSCQTPVMPRHLNYLATNLTKLVNWNLLNIY